MIVKESMSNFIMQDNIYLLHTVEYNALSTMDLK